MRATPILLVPCFVALSLLACRTHHQTLQVNLPTGFSGQVDIECLGAGGTTVPVNVNAAGKASAEVCPKDEMTDVLLVRDGKDVQASGAFEWQRTGDGIPVKLVFSVK